MFYYIELYDGLESICWRLNASISIFQGLDNKCENYIL